MAAPLIVAAGIGAAAGLAGDFLNQRSQKKNNEAERKHNIAMYERQLADNENFWNMQNAYNDPSAQMERLKGAGLNPHLVYGNGTSTTAGPISGASAPSWNPKAPQTKTGEILSQGIQQHVNLKMAQAQISKTEADTRATNIGADNQAFMNKVNTDEILEALKQQKLFESQNKGLQGESLVNQNRLSSQNASNQEALSGKNGGENLIIKKYAKEIQVLQRLGDSRALDNKLKEMEYDMMKMGIYKTDNIFLRMLQKSGAMSGAQKMYNNQKQFIGLP